jgi:formylglycine-generating enzyme
VRALLGFVFVGAALGFVACSNGSDRSGDGGAAAATASVAAPKPSASTSAAPRLAPAMVDEDEASTTLDAQRNALLKRMRVMLELDDEAIERLTVVLTGSKHAGQGNPLANQHPLTRRQCREARQAAGVTERVSSVCKRPFMVPIYDRAKQRPEDARLCMDAYEFPGIPCEYPVTWVSAKDAVALCGAVGKRLCDAHEWEGACAGAVLPPETEYDFTKPRKESKFAHNAKRETVWAYGKSRDAARCGTGGKKSRSCDPISFKGCGSNTFPAGSFPGCVSAFGVYDQHGNAAEHMNLPTKPEEIGARGGLGQTEMKGSWFIFDGYQAHEDDCRWRAPDWHGTSVTDPNSHANYHLGLRCCVDLR